MPLSQQDVDDLFSEFSARPEYQLADRQTQAVLNQRFQEEIGSPSWAGGALKGFLRGLGEGVASLSERAMPEPLKALKLPAALTETIARATGEMEPLTALGEEARGFGKTVAEEAPTMLLAGGAAKLGLKGLSYGARKVGASALSRLTASVAKAKGLMSSTAREAVTGYVYGELADKDPLEEAAVFGSLNVGMRAAGKVWRWFRRPRKAALPPTAPLPSGAPAAPPPPSAEDVVVGSSSADLVRRARLRHLDAEAKIAESAPTQSVGPPPSPIALPETGGGIRTPERQAALTGIAEASPLDRNAAIRRKLEVMDAARQVELRKAASRNPYLSESENAALGYPALDPALTGTPDGLATLQKLRNRRQLRDYGRQMGYPEEIVNDASSASLWEALTRGAKPEELSVLYGPPRPIVLPKQSPTPTTGAVSLNLGEGSFAVKLLGPRNTETVAAASDAASLARAEAAPGAREFLDGLDAIREIDEALLSPMERDIAWAAAKGREDVEPLAAKGMKFFTERVRSRTLARSFAASEEILHRAGRFGREFRERASQAQDLAMFVESRAIGSTRLLETLKTVKDWDGFLDAYQLGKGRAEPEAVGKTRQVLDAMAAFFEEHGVMTRRWDPTVKGKWEETTDAFGQIVRREGEWTKVPFERLKGFLPAVPDEKLVAAKLRDSREILRIAEKYNMAPEEVESILGKMVTPDPATGAMNVDFISRKLNLQGAEQYRDWGLVTDMSKAIPAYLRSKSKSLALLRAFGGIEPAQVKALSAAARAGDERALAGLRARTALPLVRDLKARMVKAGADEVLVDTAANALLGRTALVEGDRLLMRAISAWQTLKLGKTAVLNASELSLLADKFGVGRTFNELARVSKAALRGKGRMFDSRAWDEAMIAYAQGVEDTFGRSPEKFTRWYLKWTGFTPVDVAGRAVGLKLGRAWIERTTELALKGEKQALSELDYLGVNLSKLKERGSLSALDASRASYRLVEDLLPISRADKLPPGWRDSLYGRLFSMFQSWGYQSAKRLPRWIKKDPLRAAKAMAFFAPSTYTALYLRRRMSAVGTDREVSYMPEKYTDVIFDLPLMTSLLGSYGNALLALHPSGDFQARRTLEGPVFGSLFSLMQASRTVGQFMASDDPDSAKIALATAKFFERELSGIPGAGFVTQPVVNRFTPSAMQRRVQARRREPRWR